MRLAAISGSLFRQSPRCEQLTQPFCGNRIPLCESKWPDSIWFMVVSTSRPNSRRCSSEIEVVAESFRAHRKVPRLIAAREIPSARPDGAGARGCETRTVKGDLQGELIFRWSSFYEDFQVPVSRRTGNLVPKPALPVIVRS